MRLGKREFYTFPLAHNCHSNVCMSDRFHLDLIRRPRRMRGSNALRVLANETELHAQHLIRPLFIIDGDGPAELIQSMPGQLRLTIPLLLEECRELLSLGVCAVALFPKINVDLKTLGMRL